MQILKNRHILLIDDDACICHSMMSGFKNEVCIDMGKNPKVLFSTRRYLFKSAVGSNSAIKVKLACIVELKGEILC